MSFTDYQKNFWDYLRANKQGKLIAISLTLWPSKRLLGKGSASMGLFSLYIFGLIDEFDVIKSLVLLSLNKEGLIKAGVYLRGPLVAYNCKPKIRSNLAIFLEANKLAISEIIGEIFNEESRQLSLIYEGVLKAIANGKNASGEITGYCFLIRL